VQLQSHIKIVRRLSVEYSITMKSWQILSRQSTNTLMRAKLLIVNKMLKTDHQNKVLLIN